MNELRWILLLLGLVVIGVVYFFSRPERRDQPWRSRLSGEESGSHEAPRPPKSESSVKESRLKQELKRLESLIVKDRREPVLGELDGLDALDNDTPDEKRSPSPQVVSDPVERIIALHIEAESAEPITGHAIARATQQADLSFGEAKIYSRIQDVNGTPQVLFNMVNMTKPGTFDPAEFNTFRTPGVTIFMTLPNTLGALATWDAMLPVAQRLSDLMKATLCDEHHCTLTRQRIASIRDELRAWDRQHQRDGLL